MVYFDGSHGLRKKALKSIDETNFYPNKGKERLRSMIELRPDWCVSRQRVSVSYTHLTLPTNREV